MCEAVEVWSLPLLAGAFLDLIITFLLLCVASTVYSSSKFLAAFGLQLRCPCDGLFGHTRRNSRCVWRDLSERLVEKVASVQVSIASRFPFGSIMMKGHEGEDVGNGNGYDVSESEWSFGSQRFESSFGKADQGDTSFCCVDSDAAKYRQPAVKGNGVFNPSPRSGIGPCRKDFARSGNISSCSLHDEQIAWAGANHKIGATSPSCFSPGPNDLSRAIPLDVRAEEEGSQSTVAKAVNGCCGTEKNEFKRVDWANVGNSCWIVDESVRESELAAKVECAGCASLCLELEKERNAAATAADVAMAMIMRLQKEKASVEMEAKQYRRMIEEKSAFDAEEMNILKEILVRREMEKHFLEKEVEVYRQMALTNEQLGNCLMNYASMQKLDIFSSKEDDVDSMWMAESVNGSNDNVQEKVVIYRGRTLSAGDGDSLLNSNETLSVSSKLSSQEVEESTILPKGNGDGSLVDVFSVDTKDAHSDTLDISHNSNSLGDDSYFHDVHVVGVVPGKSSRNKDGRENRSAMNPSRSSSDLMSRMPVVRSSHGGTVPLNFHRNEMSAFHNERVRIDNEVERLKVVQQGREKLKICSWEWGSGFQRVGNREVDCNVEHRNSLPPLSSGVVGFLQ